jgi:rhomboid protease GluP
MVAEEPEERVQVGEWPSLGEVHEHALVVLAMQRDCWIREDEGRYAIEVEPAAAEAVSEEFSLYAAEQAEWRERVEMPVFSSGFELALLWVISLLLAFMAQDRIPDLVDRFCNSSFGVLRDGEWWRPFTALFLHADGPHLLGNVLLGGFFCVLVAQTFGALRGWALIFASGTLGNVVNLLPHRGEPYLSLGASTATFGALGLLVGAGVCQAWHARHWRELKPLIVPLGAGLIALGWWGGGGASPGDRTDVTAHVFGWLVGIVLGAVVAAGMMRRQEQATAGLAG